MINLMLQLFRDVNKAVSLPSHHNGIKLELTTER
jgi:hypothetical protein